MQLIAKKRDIMDLTENYHHQHSFSLHLKSHVLEPCTYIFLGTQKTFQFMEMLLLKLLYIEIGFFCFPKGSLEISISPNLLLTLACLILEVVRYSISLDL